MRSTIGEGYEPGFFTVHTQMCLCVRSEEADLKTLSKELECSLESGRTRQSRKNQ